MFPKECNEIINRNSRYEQLLRGEIGGENIKLIFVDSNKKQHEKRREIMAHKAFLHSCGFISAAFVENRFAEGESGECLINVPPGTFGAVDSLMRWFYDSRCQFDIVESIKTELHVLEQYVTGIPALWVLADFLQCKELCDTIIDTLKCGKILQTGISFAVLVEEVEELGIMSSDLLGAAIDGLPLNPVVCEWEDIDTQEKLQTMLDYGGDKMLNALAKCYHLVERITQEGAEGGANDSVPDFIVYTLAEHLAEMKRDDRAKMMPSLFLRCIAQFPPGSVPEANYAKLVMDYIEDRDKSDNSLSESCLMMLLGTIDFGVISRDTLVHDCIPRVEKLVPFFALVLNDYTTAAPIATRCSLSKQTLLGDGAVKLSCGNVLSYWAYNLLNKARKDDSHSSQSEEHVVRCPFCRKETHSRQHWLALDRYETNMHISRLQTIYCDYYIKYCQEEDDEDEWNYEDVVEFQFQEIESSRSFFNRKSTKSKALMRWVSSQGDTEDENAISERKNKRYRSDSSSLLQSNGLFVRVLNQCSEMDLEKVFFHSIRTTNSLVKDTIKTYAACVTIPAEQIGFFRYESNGFSLGEKLQPGSSWNRLGFNLQGADEELIIARRLQTAGKPVIRIYSEISLANMEVAVELKDWVDALTYPRAVVEKEEVKSTILSWLVDVSPRDAVRDHSSILEHKSTDGTSREYSYLFWEASTMEPFRICMNNASCVRSALLSDGLLQDALIAQGLSTDEATEMATHWLPALTKKDFAIIEFLPSKELDKRAKLSVTPSCQVHRVFMLFRSTDACHSCDLPLVRTPALTLPRGGGCTVVEWGGMECF